MNERAERDISHFPFVIVCIGSTSWVINIFCLVNEVEIIVVHKMKILEEVVDDREKEREKL